MSEVWTRTRSGHPGVWGVTGTITGHGHRRTANMQNLETSQVGSGPAERRDEHRVFYPLVPLSFTVTLLVLGVVGMIAGAVSYARLQGCTARVCPGTVDTLVCCRYTANGGTFCKDAPVWGNTSDCSLWSKGATVGGHACDFWKCSTGKLQTETQQSPGVVDSDGTWQCIRIASAAASSAAIVLLGSWIQPGDRTRRHESGLSLCEQTRKSQ